MSSFLNASTPVTFLQVTPPRKNKLKNMYVVVDIPSRDMEVWHNLHLVCYVRVVLGSCKKESRAFC